MVLVIVGFASFYLAVLVVSTISVNLNSVALRNIGIVWLAASVALLVAGLLLAVSRPLPK